MNEDYSDTSGYSRLFLAVHNGEIDLLPSLLKEYSNTNEINGKTLINVAAARGHAEIVRMLMKTDTDINTLLHVAIVQNQPPVFHLLIKDCDVNVKDCVGETALHYAANYDRFEFVKTLIENGANVNIQSIHGRTPIFYALDYENVQLADILFQNGAILTLLDDKKPEILKSTARMGNLEMIKLVIKHGWNDINILLQLAVRYDHLDVVKYLIKSVSKSSGIITQDDLNLYSICIKNNRINILKYLVDSGIKSRRIILDQQMLLLPDEIWKYLLTCRSKIIANFSETELHSAVRAGELETVKSIVTQKANIVETDSLACKLAVYIAVENGNADILQILLNAGFSVTSCFPDISPLHLAATYEDTRLLEMLLKAGADVNSETADCLNPLHFAALAIQSNLVKFLLENGANPTNVYHQSSLSFALKSFPFTLHKTCITSSVFTNLVEITKILMMQNTNEDFSKLFLNAANVKVYSDENNKNTEFRPDLLTCIFNHLTDDCIEYYSQSLLNKEHIRHDLPSELLHLLLEYNDLKSCDNILFHWKRDYFLLQNYTVRLSFIDYSRNIDGLLNFEYFLTLHNDNEQDKVKFSPTLKLIIARLVLLTDSGDSRVLEFCRRQNFLDWYKECETQKGSMQNTQVADDFKVTFHDILTEPVDKVANYVRNDNFHKVIESSYDKFPAFSDFLKIRIEKGDRRKNLREECTNIMFNLIKGNHKIELLDDHLDQIFQYFSVVDLRRFSAAFS